MYGDLLVQGEGERVREEGIDVAEQPDAAEALAVDGSWRRAQTSTRGPLAIFLFYYSIPRDSRNFPHLLRSILPARARFA